MDEGHLTATGQSHAQDWATYFTTARVGEDPFPGQSGGLRPELAALFAMKQTSGLKSDGAQHSNRPVETLTPLAQSLGVPLQALYTVDEVQAMAKAASQCAGKVVVICWEHDAIPLIVNELLKLMNSPLAWTGKSEQTLFWNRDLQAKWNDPVDFDTLFVLDPQKETLESFTGCHVDSPHAKQQRYAQLSLS